MREHWLAEGEELFSFGSHLAEGSCSLQPDDLFGYLDLCSIPGYFDSLRKPWLKLWKLSIWGIRLLRSFSTFKTRDRKNIILQYKIRKILRKFLRALNQAFDQTSNANGAIFSTVTLSKRMLEHSNSAKDCVGKALISYQWKTADQWRQSALNGWSTV